MSARSYISHLSPNSSLMAMAGTPPPLLPWSSPCQQPSLLATHSHRCTHLANAAVPSTRCGSCPFPGRPATTHPRGRGGARRLELATTTTLLTAYVGFSSSTGVMACSHYVLSWCFALDAAAPLQPYHSVTGALAAACADRPYRKEEDDSFAK